MENSMQFFCGQKAFANGVDSKLHLICPKLHPVRKRIEGICKSATIKL